MLKNAVFTPQAARAKQETEVLVRAQRSMQIDILEYSHAALNAAVGIEAISASLANLHPSLEMLEWVGQLKNSLLDMISLAKENL
jgi:hypothetical protein